MKKFLILILVIFTTSSAFAKRIKRESLEIDYSTLSIETILSLEPSKEYNLKFINLPENISSTKFKKNFKGSFVNISSSREKVDPDFSSTHRVRTKKIYDGLLAVTLELYEKAQNNSDDSNDDDEKSLVRKGSDDDSSHGPEDNILVESINFNIQVLPLLY
jgi:hypothetical protein